MRIFEFEKDSRWSLDWRFGGQDAINILLPKPGKRFSLGIQLLNFNLLWIDIDWFGSNLGLSLCLLGIYCYLYEGKFSFEIYPYKPRLWFNFQIELFNMTMASLGWEKNTINIGLLGCELYLATCVIFDAVVQWYSERKGGLFW